MPAPLVRILFLGVSILIYVTSGEAQKKRIERSYQYCFWVGDIFATTSNFHKSSQYLRCRPGEHIASVGASNEFIFAPPAPERGQRCRAALAIFYL